MNASPASFAYESHDEQGTARFGEALAAALPERAVIALNGTLGAGKTRLVQALAEALGVDRRDVISPTFMLVQEYSGRRPIYHFDAYRLAGEDEFWRLDLTNTLPRRAYPLSNGLNACRAAFRWKGLKSPSLCLVLRIAVSNAEPTGPPTRLCSGRFWPGRKRTPPIIDDVWHAAGIDIPPVA